LTDVWIGSRSSFELSLHLKQRLLWRTAWKAFKQRGGISTMRDQKQTRRSGACSCFYNIAADLTVLRVVFHAANCTNID
jgi:hypothetical protein